MSQKDLVIKNINAAELVLSGGVIQNNERYYVDEASSGNLLFDIPLYMTALDYFDVYRGENQPTAWLPQVIFQIDGQERWYNTISEEWENSDGTFAQSTLVSDLTSSVTDRMIEGTDPVEVKIKAWFDTTSIGHAQFFYGFTTVAEYVARKEVTPPLCRVYGYITDINQEPVQNARVEFNGPSTYLQANGRILFPQAAVKTDSAGYFEVNLVPSSQLPASGNTYEFSYRYNRATVNKINNQKIRITVPDAAEAEITTLITI